MEDFKRSTVYQIYIKSFCDSNGDGIGDLNGIRSRLPYLKWLGIDYIWVTPFFLSPMNDNGYDVADYYQVNPMFGTMEDAEALIREADRLGIGMMFDMVFNHTSTDHAWFQKALEGDPKYRQYYIFKDPVEGHEPTNWVSKFGGSAWEYVPSLGKYYLHLFDRTQADLNWENPEVREELKQVVRFWKDKGLKGFRFDVVNLISKPEVFENDDLGDGRRFYTDGRHVHSFLKELVRDAGIDTERDGMVTVGEMSSTSLENCIRYTNPADHELSMAFSFHHLKVDYGKGDKWALKEPDYQELKHLFQTWQEGMQKEGGWNAVFWCNHDQPRIVSRFGDDRIGGGDLPCDKDRINAMEQVKENEPADFDNQMCQKKQKQSDCDQSKRVNQVPGKTYWKESAKMLGTAIHMMRGTPYIYQGEELGMTNADFRSISDYRDVESLNYFKILTDGGMKEDEALNILAARSRDNGRTPMQWDGSEGAGFTGGKPWIGIPDNHSVINAAREEQDLDSILHYYRRLIALRKQYQVISDGSIRFLPAKNDQLLAYERNDETGRLLVVCNFSGSALSAEKLLEGKSSWQVLAANYPDIPQDADLGKEVTQLRPYECLVLLSSKT